MAKSGKEKEVIDLLEEVFGQPPGSRLGKPLKEGASIQGTVDGEKYFLLKKNSSLVVREGVIDNPDIMVAMNRAACEYMAGAEQIEDLVTRARECIEGSRRGCEMTYLINASLARLLLKGYLDFARAFGIR